MTALQMNELDIFSLSSYKNSTFLCLLLADNMGIIFACRQIMRV